MIRLLFTKGKNPISKLITWGLDEEVSHFAVCFFNTYVIHSNLKGVVADSLPFFLKHSDIVWEYELNWNKTQAVRAAKRLWKKVGLAGYDFKFFGFLMWEGLKYKFLNQPLDFERVSHAANKFLCTEVAEIIGITQGLKRHEYSTPGRLMAIIKKRAGEA